MVLKPRKLIRTILALAVIGLLAWTVMAMISPTVYQNRTLEEWAKEIASGYLFNTNALFYQEAIEALNSKRRQAIHELVERMRERQEAKHANPLDNRIGYMMKDWIAFLIEDPWKEKQDAKLAHSKLLESLRPSFTELRREVEKELDSDDLSERSFGLQVISYADKELEKVRDELSKAFTDTSGPQFQREMLVVAAKLDEDAGPLIPHVIRHLHSPDFNTARIALNVLEGIGPAATTAIPELLQIHSSTNRFGIALFHCFSRISVPNPELKQLLEATLHGDLNNASKLYAALALLRIDPEHRKAQSLLLGLLDNEESRKRHGIRSRIEILHHWMESEAPADFAADELQELVRSQDMQTMTRALKIAAQSSVSNQVLQVAYDRHKSEPRKVQRHIIHALLQIDPSKETAIQHIIDSLERDASESESYFFGPYLFALEQIGTNALPAADVLEKLTHHENPQVANRAANILRLLKKHTSI